MTLFIILYFMVFIIDLSSKKTFPGFQFCLDYIRFPAYILYVIFKPFFNIKWLDSFTLNRQKSLPYFILKIIANYANKSYAYILRNREYI